jgi:hypothetical protein
MAAAEVLDWINHKTGALQKRRALQFLSDSGFGNFQFSGDHIAEQVLFQNKHGVLEIHSPISVRNFLVSAVERQDSVSESDKDLFLDKLLGSAPTTIQTLLHSLPKYSESGEGDTQKLNMFRDSRDKCHVHFRNGTIEITAKGVKLLSRTSENAGCIWKSKVIDRDIAIDEASAADRSSPFRDFVYYAMMSKTEPRTDLANPQSESDTDRWKDALDAFETGFGYLVHEYNPPDQAKVIVFTDLDSSPGRTDGGTGKSVTMECVKYFRKIAFVDGKAFRKALNESSRFNFSSVQVDTGFVFINDLNPDFDLTQLFSIITDDMTVEQKGRNKVVISKDKKPKMGLTTNYVITGVGNSFERRQHIVEFGNFWSRCGRKGIKPKDIIGKNIGEGFDEDDWNDFYNYGFCCVHRYLAEGLLTGGNSSYQIKALTQSIEGLGSSGDIVRWIDNWVRTTRIEGDYHKTGIVIDDLYASFIADNDDLQEQWTMAKFFDAVFKFAQGSNEFEYNSEKASTGDTKSARRIRVGSKGKQRDVVKITDR